MAIETGCEATVSRVQLPFACRHEDCLDPDKLRSDVKELLEEDYITDEMNDMDLLHILCVELQVDRIRGDQWWFVEAHMYKGNNYYLQCDNILDGLCIIYLQSMKDKENAAASASVDGTEDDTSD